MEDHLIVKNVYFSLQIHFDSASQNICVECLDKAVITYTSLLQLQNTLPTSNITHLDLNLKAEIKFETTYNTNDSQKSLEALKANDNFKNQGENNKINDTQILKNTKNKETMQQSFKSQFEFVTPFEPYDCTISDLNIYKRNCGLKNNFLVNFFINRTIINKTGIFESLITNDIEDNLYRCGCCFFQTYSLLLLALHNERHDRLVFVKTEFDNLCLKTMENHIKNEMHQCKECNYKSRYKSDLKKHIRSVHTKDIDWFKCELCDYKAKFKSDLKRHIICLHTTKDNIKWFKCKFCDYKAKLKGHLTSHIYCIHTHNEAEINWFKCQFCNYKAKIRGTLKDHILQVHTHPEDINWFKCEQCDYKAKCKKDLKRHIIRLHTKEEDIVWFKCEMCNYKSKGKDGLKGHIIRVHAKEENIRRFQCEFCDYKSNFKGTLKNHVLQVHTPLENIEWFKCLFCNYKAKLKGPLKIHILKMHSKNENVKEDINVYL